MAAEFICDGCGKRVMATQGPHGQWLKPHSWYQRSDEDGIQVACSRACIARTSEKSGKTKVVLPI